MKEKKTQFNILHTESINIEEEEKSAVVLCFSSHENLIIAEKRKE
jgi:hypothetical protein